MSTYGESKKLEYGETMGKTWLKKLMRIEEMLESGVEVINPGIEEV